MRSTTTSAPCRAACAPGGRRVMPTHTPSQPRLLPEDARAERRARPQERRRAVGARRRLRSAGSRRRWSSCGPCAGRARRRRRRRTTTTTAADGDGVGLGLLGGLVDVALELAELGLDVVAGDLRSVLDRLIAPAFPGVRPSMICRTARPAKSAEHDGGDEVGHPRPVAGRTSSPVSVCRARRPAEAEQAQPDGRGRASRRRRSRRSDRGP